VKVLGGEHTAEHAGVTVAWMRNPYGIGDAEAVE
jgi:hypothetical protein